MKIYEKLRKILYLTYKGIEDNLLSTAKYSSIFGNMKPFFAYFIE